MTQLIAHLKQITFGDGVQPSHIYVMARVVVAFTIGVIIATVIF